MPGSVYEGGASTHGGVAPSPQTNPPPGPVTQPGATEPSTTQPSTQGQQPGEPSTNQPSTTEGGQAGLEFPSGTAEANLLQEAKTGATGAAGPKAGVSQWIVLDDVQFSSGSAELSPDADTQIGHVAQIMEQHPDVRLQLGGFTDATGSAQRNRKLSQERADAVRKALIEQGVDPSRVRARGYGSANPVQGGGGDVQANRRVAARVIAG